MDARDGFDAFIVLVVNMRAAQRDFFLHGKTSVAECRRLERAVDCWLEENGFVPTPQRVIPFRTTPRETQR